MKILPTPSTARPSSIATVRLVAAAALALGLCAHASAASAQTATKTLEPLAWHPGVGMSLRLDHTAFVNTGVQQTRGGFGVFFRPVRRLAVDVDVQFGGGRWRRPWGVDNFVTMAAALDVRAYLTVRSPVQLFAVGGIGLGAATGSTSATPPAAGEECPGDAAFFYDLSAGVGAEFVLGRSASLLATARVLRRGHLGGELEFLASRVNPPLEAQDHMLGASFGLTLVGYFSH